MSGFRLAAYQEGAPFGYTAAGRPRAGPTVLQLEQLKKHGVSLADYAPGAKEPRKHTDEHKEKALLTLTTARDKAKIIREKKRELMIKTYGKDWAKGHRLTEISTQEALNSELSQSKDQGPESEPEQSKPQKITRAIARGTEMRPTPSLGALVDIVGNLIADVRESKNAADDIRELIKSESADRAQRRAEKMTRLQAERDAKAKLEVDEREALISSTEQSNKIKHEETERQKIQIIKEQEQNHKTIIKNGRIW